MGSYEPSLFPSEGRSNIPHKQTFCLEVTYGAGAPASAKGRYLLLEATATGRITVTFPKTYRRLTGFRWGWTKYAAGAVHTPVVLTNNITTASASGGGSLVIETRLAAGAATNPASGDVLTLEFDVTNDVIDDAGAVAVTTP